MSDAKSKYRHLAIFLTISNHPMKRFVFYSLLFLLPIHLASAYDVKILATQIFISLGTDPVEAEKITEELNWRISRIDSIKDGLGESDPAFLDNLDRIALAYHSLGDYESAMDYAAWQCEITNTSYGSESPRFCHALLRCAQSYAIGQPIDAKYNANYVLQFYESQDSTSSEDYIEALLLRASCYSRVGAFNAVRDSERAYNISLSVYGPEHMLTDKARFALATFKYRFAKDANLARELLQETLAWREKNYGTASYAYTEALVGLANMSGAKGDYSESAILFNQLMEIQDYDVRKNLLSLPRHLQKSYWSKFQYYYSDLIPKYAYFSSNNEDSMGGIAYNASLFKKGLLLFAESMDSKYNEASAAEKENIVKQASTTWASIKQALKDDEAAVEFLEFGYSEQLYTNAKDENGKTVRIPTDIARYSPVIALVLTSDSDQPQLVPVCDAKEISKMKSNKGYDLEQVTRLILTPLKPALSGKRNVYFSPDGILNEIPIEYNSTTISHAVYHRLSSTSLLKVRFQAPKALTNAVIYGGLDYDDAGSSFAPSSYRACFDFSNAPLLDVIYLPSCLKEALLIDSLFCDHKDKSVLYTGNKGTEASFKALSGKSPCYLHLATHGYYWNKELASALLDKFVDPDDNEEQLDDTDISMIGSGLLLAGCNNEIEGGDEDGILTALEVSKLDLSNVELVSLSACQSGLGDVNAEGVYGLQRGFKKAGVQSILMSLWSVDDEATNLLMSYFYEQMLKGKTKSQALELAKVYVKNYERTVAVIDLTPGREVPKEHKGDFLEPYTTYRVERPYSDPQYWAAFVLLDAID